ncbi:MAG: hypothetical protein GY940_36905, partial [bacterium]|nr:hypothetical protein [bacterium]
MKKSNNVLLSILFTLLIVGFTTGINWAADHNEVAEVMVGSSGLSWNPKVEYGQLVLTVSRPDGQIVSKTFNAGMIPGFDLSDGNL